MAEVCAHRWITRSRDDFCYCMYCMEEWDEHDSRSRKEYTNKMAQMVKVARIGLNLSQQKFANLMGIDSARTVRYYESGERELPIWVSNKIMALNKNQHK